MSVECWVSDLECVECADILLIPAMVIEKLRNAGIPVKGVLIFGGIESGLLVESREIGGYRYTWSEDR